MSQEDSSHLSVIDDNSDGYGQEGGSKTDFFDALPGDDFGAKLYNGLAIITVTMQKHNEDLRATLEKKLIANQAAMEEDQEDCLETGSEQSSENAGKYSVDDAVRKNKAQTSHEDQESVQEQKNNPEEDDAANEEHKQPST